MTASGTRLETDQPISSAANTTPTPTPAENHLVERDTAERVLRRAGYSPLVIGEILGPIRFPAPLSVVLRRGERFGISTGSLMERLGGSP